MELQDVLVDVRCKNINELKAFLSSMNKSAVYNLIVDFSGVELSNAIENYFNIAKVTFSDKVENLENFSLEWCNHVIWVDLPKNLKSIGDYAFYSCESLLEISIPNSVKSIGDSAFNGCIKIKELKLPKTKLPSNLIDDCRSLKTLVLADSNYKDSIFYRNLALSGCKKLKNIIVTE